MKNLICVLLLFLVALPSLAQSPVRKDLLEVLNKVPPPPATVSEAYAKIAGDTRAGSTAVKADRLFEEVEHEMQVIEATYEAQAKAGSAGAPPGVPADMAEKMKDPEFKKKMKSMTKEEKMKMAMEMSKSVQPGKPPLEAEPPPVQEVMEEWNRMALNAQKAFEEGVAAEEEVTRLKEEDSKAHERIGAWEKGEVQKVPLLSTGEMSYRDPEKLKVVRLEASDRHIAQSNETLGRFGKSWRASIERTTNRFSNFNQKLIAADYASASKNFSTLKTLSDGQMILLKRIESLAQQSRAAYEESARWMALRKGIEQQKE